MGDADGARQTQARALQRAAGNPRARAPGRRVGVVLAVLMAWTAVAARGDGPDRPPENPRVRLEAVVEPRSGALARLLRTVVGKERSTLFVRPWGVAWDGDDLLVTDPGAGRVVRLGRKGKVLARFDGPLVSPIGVAACTAGVVVTDSVTGTVTLLSPELRRLRLLAEGLKRPTGVACRGAEIFVAETGAHHILVLAPDGSRRTLGRRGAGPGELNFPTSLTFDGASLWVGDTLNFRLQRLDPVSGERLGELGRLGDAPGETPRIKGVAVDRDGHLWVADAHLDQVALFRPDGTFLIALGRRGDLPGEFSFPADIAAHPDGRVAVVDSLNRRLQLFRLPSPGEGTK